MIPNKASGVIGLVGGLIDLFMGASIFQQTRMEMTHGAATLLSYFLLTLGTVVLLTGAYVLVSMKHRVTIGWLMLVYGLIMLILGVGMIGRLFNFMMQWSSLSGIAMIVLGVAMLYSGFGMIKGFKGKMM